jgi:hypothetical protein
MASIISIERLQRRTSMQTSEGTMSAAGSAKILFFTGVRREPIRAELSGPAAAADNAQRDE